MILFVQIYDRNTDKFFGKNKRTLFETIIKFYFQTKSDPLLLTRNAFKRGQECCEKQRNDTFVPNTDLNHFAVRLDLYLYLCKIIWVQEVYFFFLIYSFEDAVYDVTYNVTFVGHTE